MKKNWYWLGMIGAIIYIMGVIIGGMLIPGYSHINQAISEIDPLISDNYRYITTILFGLYNLSCFMYGIALFLEYKKGRLSNKVQAVSLGIIGLSGILMYFFPMDIVGSKTTFLGIMHIILVGIVAPLTILATALGFVTFKDKKWMKYYSLITCVIVTISGGFTAYFASEGMQSGFGILERITIGSFILWLFISGIYNMKRSK